MDSAHRALVMLLFTLLAVGPAWSAPRYITPQPLVQELADVQVGPVAQAASQPADVQASAPSSKTIRAATAARTGRPDRLAGPLNLPARRLNRTKGVQPCPVST